jgi:predicted ATPase/class 3 adenylate cyclase
MKFINVLARVTWLLLTDGIVSYRRLQREFDLDSDALEDVRRELIQMKCWAIDRDGEFLVWVGTANGSSPSSASTLAPLESLAPLPGKGHGESVQDLEPDKSTAATAPTETTDISAACPPTSDAERRPLTVMFCDMADSTALSTQLDPEDLQDVIRAYQETCTKIFREYEGFIARYMGDGILIYFGYPKSLERNAERAVRSALDIIDAMTELNQTLDLDKDKEIAVRIGIATGTVMVGEIVGEGMAQERTVIGEAPNLAARLQGLARRNGVIVGSLTREVAGDVFDYEDMGSHELKGIPGRVATWGVTGLHDNDARENGDDANDGPAQLPVLVGRDEEIGLLRRAWQSTENEGRGQVVTINGEAGIGKSVLLEGLKAEVLAENSPQLTMRCSPYHTNSALYPVIEHFKRLARWQPEDSNETRLDKLETMLKRYEQPLEESVPLMASLLSLALPDGQYPILELTPLEQKQQTQDMIIGISMEVAEQRPFLQLWEDLHWADPSTQELIGLLIEQAPTTSLLMILTNRPEFVPPWPPRSHITPITLNRLERSHAEAMVTRIAGQKQLPGEVIEHIVKKTDGVPLYVEELTKTILSSDILRQSGDHLELTGPLSSLSIPGTLQESLMARLDRLPQVREIAQLGSVLGREFAYEMITGLSTIDEATLQQGLGQLVEAELLYQRGRPPRARYIFKHALVQDAAYGSLLRRPRQQHHMEVAQLLESRFPDIAEANPELVAHHYTEAGATEQAVANWLKAGQRAARKSAHLEAITHLRQGLNLLTTLPETTERAKLELAFQSTLGPAVVATQGYASPDTGQVYSRSRELCKLVGEAEDIYPVLFGVYLFELGRARHERALDLAEEFLERTQQSQDSAAQAAGNLMKAVSLVHIGKQTIAHQHCQKALDLHDPDQHRPIAFRYGLEIRTAVNAYDAWALWLLGYPDQALERGRQSLDFLKRIKHPYTQSRALYWNTVLHEFRREWPIVDERASSAMQSASKNGFALVLATSQIMQGAAIAATGQGKAGLQQMRDGLDAYQATGGLFQRTYLLAKFAEALNAEGLPEEGLEALQEAAKLAETSSEFYYESEIHRLRGELLLAASPKDAAEAEACYQQALEVARRQEAKSLELRAAASLARLWQQQGRQKNAHELLAPIYGWFSEGFDTADLIDAKELLSELSAELQDHQNAG